MRRILQGRSLQWMAGEVLICELVLRQVSIDGLRVAQMIQDKAWPAENGQPFSKTATQDWIIWVTPSGRSGKHLPACVTPLFERACHSRQAVPNGQLLLESLSLSILDDGVLSLCYSPNAFLIHSRLRPLVPDSSTTSKRQAGSAFVPAI